MLKIGLIGCGFMGGMHAACYKEIEGAQVVAVADIRSEKAAEIAGPIGAAVYENGELLIENADVDVIDICLPTYLHTAHAVLAMKKGRSVFIEKPVCRTMEETALLQKTAQETGANVQIGQVIRFWDEYKWLKEVTDRKEYGELQSAVFTRLSPWPDWAWEGWIHEADKSGSMALDLHVHDVDFMRYLLGDPDSFSSRAVRDERGVIEQIFTTYMYGEKVVTIEGCWDYPADFPFEAGFRVKFEKGTAVLNPGRLTVYRKDGGIEKPEIKPAFTGENKAGGNLSSLGGYYNELAYFVKRLRKNEPLLVAPLDEGIESAALALREIESVGGAQV
ncbi:MAG: Gfo/Idh/MocA family oxidoreductase [Ruminococcaceae bacterium]|nr:Gfo/Idh/MocA family oxidoreductase [Oscillospiraceae bacterium]